MPVRASGPALGVAVSAGDGSGVAVVAGEGFGVAISLRTAGDTVGRGDWLADAPGWEKDGNAMPRSPMRMTLPTPRRTTAVRPLANPTAPIRSSACFTRLSNGAWRASQRVRSAYPARHRSAE